MAILLLVALLAIILFGVGFALHLLWYIAIIVAIIWLIGFFVRPTGVGGARGRWYRW